MKCCSHILPSSYCFLLVYRKRLFGVSWVLEFDSNLEGDTSILLLLLHPPPYSSSIIPLPPSYSWPWNLCLQYQDTTSEQKTNKENNNLWFHLLGTIQRPVLLFFSCICLDYCFVWLVYNYCVNCGKLNFCRTAVVNGNYFNSKILEPRVPLPPCRDYSENSIDWPTISWEGHMIFVRIYNHRSKVMCCIFIMKIKIMKG